MNWKQILKAAFVLGLLFYLGQKGFISVEAMKRAFLHWDIMLLAYLLLTISFFLGVFRWQLLLSAQDVKLTSSRTLQLGLIGNFFNIALPGAVTGDVVKAIYVSKEAPGKAAPALGSILFDRITGVSGLVLISTFALLLSRNAPWSDKLLDSIEVAVIASGAIVLVFYSYLFALKDHHDPVLILLKRFEPKFKKLGSFKRTWEGLRVYRDHRGSVFTALLISVLIHSLVILACVIFARSLGEDQLASGALFVIVPLGLLVTAVPVMPGGVGTGHAAFAALFQLLGSQRGADVFTFFLFSQVLYGGIGGLVYLRFKHSQEGAVALSAG